MVGQTGTVVNSSAQGGLMWKFLLTVIKETVSKNSRKWWTCGLYLFI